MSVSERDRGTGAGCLLILGMLLLWPMLLIGAWVADESLRDWRNFFSALRWATWRTVWSTILEFFRPRTGSNVIPSVLFIPFLGYFPMMWQWLAHVCKWRGVLPARRLWMLSSIYFIAFALMVTYATYPWLAQIKEQSASDRLLETILWIALCWVPPGVFLSLTIPLWYYAPKVGAETQQSDK